MTYVGSSATDAAEDGATVIRRPRVTDAVGAALRRAYDGYSRLPADWQRSLDALDRHG